MCIRLKIQRGITLIEITLALAIFGIVSLAVFSAFQTHFGSISLSTSDYNIRSSARESMNVIAHNIQEADSISLPNTGQATSSQLVLTINGENIILSYDETNKRMLKTVNGSSTPIALSVSSTPEPPKFTFDAATGLYQIKIHFEEKGRTFILESSAKPRVQPSQAKTINISSSVPELSQSLFTVNGVNTSFASGISKVYIFGPSILEATNVTVENNNRLNAQVPVDTLLQGNYEVIVENDSEIAVGGVLSVYRVPPEPPINFSGTANSQTSITWSWDNWPSNWESFVFYDELGSSEFTSTSFTETGLSPDTSYTRYLTAKNSAGESSFIMATAKTLAPDAPPPPSPPPKVVPIVDDGQWKGPGQSMPGWGFDDNNKLVTHNPASLQWVYYTKTQYSDFEMEVKVSAVKSGGHVPSGDIGLLYFFNADTQNGDFFGIKMNSRQFVTGTLSNKQYRNLPPSFDPSFSFLKNTEYTLKIISSAGQVRLYVNGIEVHSYASTQSGYIAVYESVGQPFTINFKFLN